MKALGDTYAIQIYNQKMAIGYYEKALKIAQRTENVSKTLSLKIIIAGAYADMGDFEKAKDVFNISFSKAIKDSKELDQ